MNLITNQIGLFFLTRIVTFFLSLYLFSLLVKTDDGDSFIGFSLYALMPIFYLTFKAACSNACKFQNISSIKAKILLFKNFGYSLNLSRWIFTTIFFFYNMYIGLSIPMSFLVCFIVFFISFDFDIFRSFFNKQIVFQYLMLIGFVMSILFLIFLQDLFLPWMTIGYLYAIAVILYFLPLAVFNIIFIIKIKYNLLLFNYNKSNLNTFLACFIEPILFSVPFYLLQSELLKDYAILHRVCFASLLFTPLIRSWLDGAYLSEKNRTSPLFFGAISLLFASIIIYPYYFVLGQMGVLASIDNISVFTCVISLCFASIILNVSLKYFKYPKMSFYFPVLLVTNLLIFFNKDTLSIIYICLLISISIVLISVIRPLKEFILNRI